MPPSGPRLTADEIANDSRAGSTRAQSGRSPAPQVLSHLVPVDTLGVSAGSSAISSKNSGKRNRRVHSRKAAKRGNRAFTGSGRTDTYPSRFPRSDWSPAGAWRRSSRLLNDRSPQAWERQVDRLLASPHYGEKWGRHWLDLARYADSDGYEQDSIRLNAWRYRDWVISAFNRNMPFDQFTIEQIAGDLLPNATIEQRAATGFHRNTLTSREGGIDVEQLRDEQVMDRTNTIGTVWLGLTVECARCHDHKYDPITQRDYYQLFAFMNSAEEVDCAGSRFRVKSVRICRKLPEYQKKLSELLGAIQNRRIATPLGTGTSARHGESRGTARMDPESRLCSRVSGSRLGNPENTPRKADMEAGAWLDARVSEEPRAARQ